jgi:antirestriction protein ArdC
MAFDVYDRITRLVIDHLEKGTIPWKKPWRGGEAGHPRNFVTRHRYRGVNVFLLTSAGFTSPCWLTYRQAHSLGGHVRKGERSTPIVFWRWLEREDSESGETQKFPLLRYFSVFNVEQVELPPSKSWAEAPESKPDFEPIAECERVVTSIPHPPSIEHGGGVASYLPRLDKVLMPHPWAFEDRESYYATLFHELVHSTGHESRLNRPGISGDIRFGSEAYSKEELIAEMGAAFLSGEVGIETKTVENSAAYVAGWLKSLRNDKRLVVHAAAAAQKAADYLLARETVSNSEPQLLMAV